MALSRRRETGTVLAEDRGGVMNYDLGVRSLSRLFLVGFRAGVCKKISIMCFVGVGLVLLDMIYRSFSACMASTEIWDDWMRYALIEYYMY
jgi:hypothetical protein